MEMNEAAKDKITLDEYRRILAELPQPVLVLSPAGTVHFANRAAREKIPGLTTDNLNGTLNDAAGRLLLLANEATAENKILETELQLGKHLFRMRAIPPEKDKTQDFVLLFGTDITNLIELENRYLEHLTEMQKIRRAFDKSAIVSETNEKGIITFVNDTFIQVSGYSREELLGKTHRIIKSDYHPPEFFAHLWQTIRSGQSWRGEICNRAKDGSLYWVDTFIHPITNDSGKINRFISVRYLITEKKKAEQERSRLIDQIQRRNADLENFSYVLSHNIRSPVANILGLLHIFEERHELSDFNRQLLQHLEKAAGQLDDMIRDLNQILQMRRSGVLPTETIHLKEILEKVQQSLDREIRTTGAVIEVDLTNCPVIKSVPAYIHSILYNLLGNAIKYQRPDVAPVIHVTATESNGEIRLTVQDNGRGMDLSHDPERIFGLYTRLSSEKEGKGIGLYLVKSQVTALDGEIEVKSTPGQGSIFTVRLPVTGQKEDIIFP